MFSFPPYSLMYVCESGNVLGGGDLWLTSGPSRDQPDINLASSRHKRALIPVFLYYKGCFYEKVRQSLNVHIMTSGQCTAALKETYS